MKAWPLMPIADLGTVFTGSTPKTSEKNFYGGDIPFVTPAELDQPDPVIAASRNLSESGAKEARLLPEGAVMVCCIGSLGKVGIAGRTLATNQQINSVVFDTSLVVPRFGYYACRRLRLKLEAMAPATTVAIVSKSRFEQLEIPVPPLAEQRRIADVLDKADALRAKRRAALAQLDTLAQSIFIDMFGDPASNPKGWPVKRIGEMTECLDRLRRPVTESDRKPGDVPYYGANGQQGWIDTELFNEPLVLVAEDGGYFDAPERGVAYRIDGPAWVNNHAHILRSISEYVGTEFLHRALRHYNFLPYISGTTRAKLTQGQLNAAKLFVPPLELQRHFAEHVIAVDRLCALAETSSVRLQTLLASLQHRAFRGEL